MEYSLFSGLKVEDIRSWPLPRTVVELAYAEVTPVIQLDRDFSRWENERRDSERKEQPWG